ncbi:MAG: LysM peptidoglycan-binding domain-containing protein [Marinoscillum sp.]|uniref:LysM peptidoglycan-binding domain-containing protein n=1 Tax=Marinoscillum sp. TaxID=2024838 RepID=UPI0032F75FE3
MRVVLLGLFLFIHTFSFGHIGGVPVVPASIEIAGIKLKLTADAREEIQKDVNALRASEKYFQIKLDRVNLYFPIIERVLKEEGVPDEIKYLSIQESALISDAVSSADAVGYWQFKDFTAREVGLRVDSKIDERKNIVSATRGAAKYFKRNNFYFKNWIYAVSAYQAGAAGAKKYVDKENFGSDKLTITSKTHWYVLRFIAHVIAFQDEVGDPHSEGLRLLEHDKGAGKTLEQIAHEFKADHTTVADYNKWLAHGKIPDDKVYTVIIPFKGKAPKGFDKENERPLTRSIEAVEPVKYPDQIASDITKNQKAIFIKINGLEAVMAGAEDNVVSLALKCGISSTQLIKNNDLNPGEEVRSGEIYYVSSKRNRSAIRFHVAQYGESLWDISQKYGVKLKKLAQKNRMGMADSVKPGRLIWLRKTRSQHTPVEYHEVRKPEPIQKVKPRPVVVKEQVKENPPAEKIEPALVEPDEKPEVEEKIVAKEAETPINKPHTSTPPSGDRLIHVVQAGETLWGISRLYEVSVNDINSWNNLNQGLPLSTGQELLIYNAVREKKSPVTEEKPAAVPESKPTADFHEVEPGESLWGISRKYNLTVEEVRSWNGLTAESTINPGQKLLIKPLEKEDEPSDPHTTHIVKGGDSLYKIAKTYDMTVQELMELNQMNSTAISVGDELKVKKR